jgi:hypothetical protein
VSKNQRGFAILEALLLLVVVGMITGTGWYAFHTKHQTDQILARSEKTSQATPSASNNTVATQKYLTIKEWGVKVKLSSNDSGAYYKVSDQSPTDSAGAPTQLTVYSTETDSLKGPAGTTCKGEYIAYLLRLPSDDSQWSDPLTQGYYPNPIQIGSHKYAASSAKQYGPSCWLKDSHDLQSVDEPTMKEFKSIANQFVEDFKSVQIQ